LKTLKNLPVVAAIAMALGGAAITPAAATTYVGTRQVGANGLVKLSVTTDDTLGILAEANILDWTIGFTNGIDSQTLFGPLSGDTSHIRLRGEALTATATQLLFDFDGSGHLLFTSEFNPAGRAYCLDGQVSIPFACVDRARGDEHISFGLHNPDNIKVHRDGRGVLGTAIAGGPDPGPAGVPEPAVWALMIAGFGLAGGQLRRRRARSTATA